ncbi:MAG TPA: hypothetical protein VGP70_25780 [Actinomadura sp.]|nr:hypothetical protein [Actinomadura sp.]
MNKHGAEESPSSEDGAAEETPAVVEAVVGNQRPAAETSEAARGSSGTTGAERDAGHKTVLAPGTINNTQSSAGEPAEAGDRDVAAATDGGKREAAVEADAEKRPVAEAGKAAEEAGVSGSSAGADDKAGLAGSSSGVVGKEPADAGDKADDAGAAAIAGKGAGGAKEARTTEAATAASVVPPSGADSATGGPQRPGRPSAPVLAAAAIGGLVLLGIPLAFSQGFFGDGHKKAAAASGLPGGATMDGYRGFVPPTAAPVPGAAPSHPGQPATSNGGPSQGGPAAPASSGGPAGSGSSGGSQPAQAPGHGAAGIGKAQGIFNVVAGPGCGGGSYSRVGYYTKGKSGWLSGSGGFSGQGCNGRFDALPMSGSDTSHDSGLYALWTFDPGSHTQCKVQIYIPNKSDRVYVGGSPAHYSVHQKNGGAILAGFSFDQPSNRGRWVNGRSFTSHGPFWVRVANIGKDWSGNKRTYAHVAAAQVRATCS